MSASEKLRELGEEAIDLGFANALTDVLPELIAIVEAAERTRAMHSEWGQMVKRRAAARDDLDAALAILHAKLTADGKDKEERN